MSEVYEVIKNIGGGSFGQVYLVRHKREEKTYVIKKIKTRDMSQQDRDNTENEVRLLQKLRHTNIVAYKDSYLDRQQYLNIVMVHCEGGDIYEKIKQAKGKNFPETQILDWIAQMSLALHYLHDQKILHRDLKTQNIFLKSGRIRLGDFGIAKMLDSTRDFANTCIGTPYYMSPELFKYKPYSYKSDIWAFGCCVYEMCNLRHAFDAQSLNGLAVKILKGSYPPINTTYSKQLRDLITKMISINPKNRPTIWDIMNKPLIKKRIINYMQELFTGNYPEANNPQDVDDVYLDSLREQGEKLGIMAQIQKQVAVGQNNESEAVSQKTKAELLREKEAMERIKNNKKELWKNMREKRNLEEEIKKLEKKKQIQEIKKERDSHPHSSHNVESSSNLKKPPMNPDRQNQLQNQQQQQGIRKQRDISQEKDSVNTNKRSYSYDRKRDSSLQNIASSEVNSQKGDGSSHSGGTSFVEKKKQEIRKSYQNNSQTNLKQPSAKDKGPSLQVSQVSTKIESESVQDQDNLSETEETKSSFQKEETSKKHMVLQQKQQKKKEEQERWEQQFKQIQQENAQNRQQAAFKQAAQYRPSTGMRSVIGNDLANQNTMYQQQQHIQIQQAPVESEQRSSLGQSGKQNQSGYDNFNQSKGQQAEQLQDNEYEYREYEQQQQQRKNSNSPSKQGKNKGNTPQREQMHIKEEYTMEDEEQYYEEDEDFLEDDDLKKEKVIVEVENEDESDHEEENPQVLDNKLDQIKTRLFATTQKISELQKSLKPVTKVNKEILEGTKFDIQENQHENEIQEESDMEENNEEQEEEEIDEDYHENEGEIPKEAKLNINPQFFKVNDRIKLLRHRCEAGLGNVIFDKAYEYLKKCGENNVEHVRKQLLKILGTEMIGFWQLIDQILVLESILNKIPKYLN